MELPLVLNVATELDNLFGDDFGFPVYPYRENFYNHRSRLPLMVNSPQNRRWLQRYQVPDTASGSVNHVGKDGFQVLIDVQQFKPNEITVKTVDNYIVVEGKHEEREDEHGSIYRHFTRRYTLPKDYDPAQVTSTLSSDGILTVKVPLPSKSANSNVRVIQIQHTGPAHLTVKGNQENGSKVAVTAATTTEKSVKK